jgi:hypothetical protein
MVLTVDVAEQGVAYHLRSTLKQGSVRAFGTAHSLRLFHLPPALDFTLLGAAPPNPRFCS